MLQVISGYRGERTQEQYIAPGYYEEDDPRLHGCGEFLIETGRAQRVSAIATFPPQTLEVKEGLEGAPLVEDGTGTNEYVAYLEAELLKAGERIEALEAKLAATRSQKAESETPPTGDDTEPLEVVEEAPPPEKPKGKGK